MPNDGAPKPGAATVWYYLVAEAAVFLMSRFAAVRARRVIPVMVRTMTLYAMTALALPGSVARHGRDPGPPATLTAGHVTTGDPSVWPSYSTMTAATNSSADAWFEVDNTDFNPENYSLYCYVTYPVTSCSAPWSVYVDGYGSASVDVIITTTVAGVGGVSLSAGGMVGGADGHYDVTVQEARIAPTIAIVSGGDIRDVSRCISNCFEKTMSFAPAPYMSMNAPRTITLMYRSGSAHPMGNVQIDVTDNSATQADLYALQLQRPDGSFVTFTNGTTVLYYQSAGHYATTHLAAAFDALSVPTGRYTYSAIVTSIWNSDGLHQPAYGTLHLIIQNESSSPFGAGWTAAGVQRAYPQSDGVLVTDGSGSATFFTGNCAPNSNCTFVSPSGEFSIFKQDLTNYHRVYPDGTDITLWFSGPGVMQTDRFGNYFLYNYSGPNGALRSIEDPAHLSILLNYEDGSGGWKVGTLRSIQTFGSNSFRYAWLGVDANNDLRQFQNVDQTYWEYADYDGSHRLSHYRDRRGGDWDYAYSLDGTMASQLAPTITINGSAQRPSMNQVAGSTNIINATTGTVGSQGNPIPCSLDTRARTTNARGYATYYSLNMWGQSTLTRDPLGRNTTASYDANTGQVQSVTRPNGHNVQYTYDGPRMTQLHDYSTGQIINTSYELTYSRPTHIWGNTVEQWFYYTGTRTDSSRYGASTSPVTKYSTDSKGRIWVTIDPGGHADTTIFAADGFQNTDSTVAAGHRATWYRYDGYGRRRALRPPVGAGDSSVYDLLNRTVQTVDIATQRHTSSEYDALYLTAISDARNSRSTYTRNALGWVEQEWRAGSANPLAKTYDANGNVLTFQNRRQQTVTFTYDALDRVTQKSMPSGSTVYAYGISDDFSSASNAASVDTIFYDASDRMTRVKTWRGGTLNWYNLQYSYNSNGQPWHLDATSNMWTGTRGPQYSYYPSGGLQYLDDFGKRTSFSEDGENLGTSIGFPTISNNTNHNSLHGTYESSFTLGTDADIRLGATGDLDDMGRIAQRVRHGNSDSLRTYVYNSDGSLAWRIFWNPTPPSCHFDADYGYVCDQGSLTQGPAEQYTYDEVGNLTNGVSAIDYPGNRIRNANGFSYEYDPDGNLTHKAGPGFTQDLSWNELGQLVSATTNGVTVAFAYDGFGRRVAGERYYLYDGSNLFMELTSGGNVAAEYSFLPGMDHPLMVSRGTELLYFAMDPLSGSVHGLIRDGDNVVRAQYGYTPYGQAEAGAFDYTQNGGNPLRFAARELDSSTGLYYFRARYYDPQIGRFVSEDPAGLSGGLNLYAYASDDPINGADPTGTWTLHWGMKWRHPWRDVLRVAPVVAFFAVGYGAGNAAVFKFFAATAAGSAAQAAVEHAATGADFGLAFRRNFGLSMLAVDMGLVYGGGVKPPVPGKPSAGARNIFQGFVVTNKDDYGAITIGAATIFDNKGPTAQLATGLSIGQHEWGHVVQMAGLSAMPGILGTGPWAPYLLLGAFGATGQLGDTGLGSALGCLWEGLASGLGSDGVSFFRGYLCP